MEPALEEALAYLLDLRLRCRGNREAMALVDRCLLLLARAQTASAAELQQLEAEFETLRSELIVRFGAPPEVLRH
jgi:IS5 family transposase